MQFGVFSVGNVTPDPTQPDPQQVIDKTMTFREHFGDYQRQLFLIDHAGLPLDVVLDQLEILGGEVVPVLRKEMAARRGPGVPGGPAHEARLAAARAEAEARNGAGGGTPASAPRRS